MYLGTSGDHSWCIPYWAEDSLLNILLFQLLQLKPGLHLHWLLRTHGVFFPHCSFMNAATAEKSQPNCICPSGGRKGTRCIMRNEFQWLQFFTPPVFTQKELGTISFQSVALGLWLLTQKPWYHPRLSLCVRARYDLYSQTTRTVDNNATNVQSVLSLCYLGTYLHRTYSYLVVCINEIIKVRSSSSTNPVQLMLQRHAQKLNFMMITNLAKLIINVNDHSREGIYDV